MTNQEIKALLLEDLEYKKFFTAAHYVQCNSCGDYIIQVGVGEFIFMGDRQKICTKCLAEITDFIGGL